MSHHLRVSSNVFTSETISVLNWKKELEAAWKLNWKLHGKLNWKLHGFNWITWIPLYMDLLYYYVIIQQASVASHVEWGCPRWEYSGRTILQIWQARFCRNLARNVHNSCTAARHCRFSCQCLAKLTRHFKILHAFSCSSCKVACKNLAILQDRSAWVSLKPTVVYC